MYKTQLGRAEKSNFRALEHLLDAGNSCQYTDADKVSFCRGIISKLIQELTAANTRM